MSRKRSQYGSGISNGLTRLFPLAHRWIVCMWLTLWRPCLSSRTAVSSSRSLTICEYALPPLQPVWWNWLPRWGLFAWQAVTRRQGWYWVDPEASAYWLSPLATGPLGGRGLVLSHPKTCSVLRRRAFKSPPEWELPILSQKESSVTFFSWLYPYLLSQSIFAIYRARNRKGEAIILQEVSVEWIRPFLSHSNISGGFICPINLFCEVD